MAIELAVQFQENVDELFSTESKTSLLTNKDYTWDGASTIKVYSVSTVEMQDYGRGGPAEGNWSRYGPVEGLDATTQAMTLRKDRSFTFAVDRLDADETKQAVQAASALARQMREVCIPEVDAWVLGQMCEKAGQKPATKALTAANIYEMIIEAGSALDNAEAPETGRVLLVTPDVYLLMKKCKDIMLETDIGADMRLRGVISNLDGMGIVKVPAARLPEGFGFMIAHPVATVAPMKLEEYQVHQNPPGISGDLVEGRLNYDAFVLNNKADAILYQAQA